MDKLLLKKFLNKKCTTEELQRVYSWLNDPKNSEEVTALLKNSWSQVSDKKPDADVDIEKLRRRILNKLSLNESDQRDPIPLRKTSPAKNNRFKNGKIKALRSRNRLRWLRVAAIIILLEGTAFLVYKFLGTSYEEPQYTEKTTFSGQRYTIFLEDGSKVILNSNSSLWYSKDFDKEARNLTLEGEAFFEVAEDQTKPFKVVTNGITTVALGTSFNIKSDPDKNILTVSLATGKVEVFDGSGENEKFILVPGEELVIDRGTRKFVKKNFDFKERLSWKDGIVYFHDTDLFEAIEVLEKWYGVEFKVLNPEKANENYGNINGEFKNESLANVLKVMSFAKGFKYSIAGKKVTIEL